MCYKYVHRLHTTRERLRRGKRYGNRHRYRNRHRNRYRNGHRHRNGNRLPLREGLLVKPRLRHGTREPITKPRHI